jgi:hypothetical protein
MDLTDKAAGAGMMLVIAWRNPFPPAHAEKEVRRVPGDQFGTLYVVTGPDATQECFELHPGGATRSDQRRPETADAGRMPAC